MVIYFDILIYALLLIYYEVNGAWGDYGDWEECSVSCGGGKQERRRECEFLDEQHKGKHCNANGTMSVDSRTCGDISCKGKNRNKDCKIFLLVLNIFISLDLFVLIITLKLKNTFSRRCLGPVEWMGRMSCHMRICRDQPKP